MKRALLFAGMILIFCLSFGALSEGEGDPGQLHFKDGMAQPMLQYSPTDTPNSESEILRFCVYVETDYDTDNDGMADLVKVFVQLPKSAAEGQYKAAAIYDPTPYPAGINKKSKGFLSYPFAEKSFDYASLYRPGKKRAVSEVVSTSGAALQADSSQWLYTVPGSGTTGYYNTAAYDYFLIRGFAVVEACGIGTYGSEGFELCGRDLERDSHKCVVEWLAGNRVAFTDLRGSAAIEADWCNGSIAMTGRSYGGTLPFEVATTGVEGLKTIVPLAGVANWYNYRNSQGVVTNALPHYTDFLASFNAGALFEDDDWLVPDADYGAWIHQITADETAANGNYTDIWAEADYSDDWQDIRCSALIIHGLNDFNVMTGQADLMYKAFEKAGQSVKLLLHQDGHTTPNGIEVAGMLYEELINRWLSHWLYGIENGIEGMAAVTVQSNVDGTYSTYDSWGKAQMLTLRPEGQGETHIQSGSFEDFYADYIEQDIPAEVFYGSMDAGHAAVYDLPVPENTTIYGIPEVRLRLKTKDVDQDNLMVSGILMDTVGEGKSFRAYMTHSQLGDILPLKTTGTFELGGGHTPGKRKTYVPSFTDAKRFSMGWMDLLDPGAAYIASESTFRDATDPDTFYDYTLYLSPTVYTVQPGHTLKLLIFAQDPYRSRLEDSQGSAKHYYLKHKEDEVYSFVIDNTSIEVNLPTTAGK